ncbi:Uncharacterised protein [Mycobacteroides abscessus subsp. abscessus]|uniref:hypothetical protein n=1 Tax=Mycobacteroides abscessus TaxID=36809 RepID=UPI000927EE8D|nr:hypothetical protein [Mycobacteroides abscessus]SHU37533.1 Uncharacterised protein [Mycobacteroides abscessus subsp. abscessus]SHW01365.1 Uncharacterised protein [Mycobacteroides abscessus subsp. abscessus]SIH24039.1 Uncharacterised protein [Mycobacteroides abscessus subsp. abscessus]SKD16696.1 Uncharacterised protein [Mycobacteroides abscessus subsp. abscessus]SKN14065.1 Uncharacterised protein [Mycobacteroides abscessus subsp. abscessus]
MDMFVIEFWRYLIGRACALDRKMKPTERVVAGKQLVNALMLMLALAAITGIRNIRGHRNQLSINTSAS